MDLCVSRERIADFLTDRLSETEEEALFAHLSQCLQCRELADAMSDDDELRSKYRDTLITPIEVDGSDLLALQAKLYQIQFPVEFATSPLSRREKSSGSIEQDSIAAGRLGRFRLLKKLGSGAFATVWLARDDLLRRDVALKVPHAAARLEPDRGGRFVREAQAAAALHHPNIVPVFEAGEAEGVPYLATALCSGSTLAEWLAEQDAPLSPKLAAEIVHELAGAVEHAHEHRILHRDIKPGNVLLDPAATNGRLPFTPMLADFGLARVSDEDQLATADGHILGTPRYMAPEQASGCAKAIGPATDVYALGVLLYELLTRRHPIEGADSVDTLRRLSTELPRPPRQFRSAIPADLEAICLKCLEKSPHRRYATARELALDLQRFRAGVSTLARPIQWPERIARWMRRHPQLAASLATCALLAIALLGGGLWYHVRLRTELAANIELRRVAEHRAEALQRRQYVRDMQSAYAAIKNHRSVVAKQLLDAHLPRDGEKDHRDFVWHQLWRQFHAAELELSHPGSVADACFTPDGERIVTCGYDSMVRVWNAKDGKPLGVLAGHRGNVNRIVALPSGAAVVSGADDGTLRWWDTKGLSEIRSVKAHAGDVLALAVSSDGRRIASGGVDHVIRLWDAATGEPQGTLTSHSHWVRSLAFSRDGQRLASGGNDGKALIWRLGTDETPAVLAGQSPWVTAVAFSKDGAELFAGGKNGRIEVWTAEGNLVGTLDGHYDIVRMITVSQDGSTMLSCDNRGNAKQWSIWNDRAQPMPPAFHTANINAIAFSPDEQRVITASADTTAKVWRVEACGKPQMVDQEDEVEGLTYGTSRFSNARLMGLGQERTLRIWNATTGLLETQWDSHAQDYAEAALPDSGKIVACADSAGRVRLVDRSTGEVLQSFECRNQRPNLVALTADGRRLAATYGELGIRVWRIPEGDVCATVEQAFEGEASALRFSPDGEWLVASQRQGPRPLAFYDTTTWTLKRRLANAMTPFDFTADSEKLATFSPDLAVKIWDVPTGSLIRTIARPAESIRKSRAIRFSPDGRLLATFLEGSDVEIWDVASGELCLTLSAPVKIPRMLSFAADGRSLLGFGHGEKTIDVFAWR